MLAQLRTACSPDKPTRLSHLVSNGFSWCKLKLNLRGCPKNLCIFPQHLILHDESKMMRGNVHNYLGHPLFLPQFTTFV